MSPAVRVRLRRTENATLCHKCNRTGTHAKILYQNLCSLCPRPRDKMRFLLFFSLLRPTLRRVVSLDFVLIVSMRRGIAMAFNLPLWQLESQTMALQASIRLPQGPRPRPPSSRLPTPIWGTHNGGKEFLGFSGLRLRRSDCNLSLHTEMRNSLRSSNTWQRARVHATSTPAQISS